MGNKTHVFSWQHKALTCFFETSLETNENNHYVICLLLYFLDSNIYIASDPTSA